MSWSEISQTIIDQTALALSYLDKAAPLVQYKKLVAAKAREIHTYEKASGKRIPPDYRYWLMNVGAGRVEFVSGALRIPCISELAYMSSQPRLTSLCDSASVGKRIYLVHSGAPAVIALDTTAVSESGCCPVITTVAYGESAAAVWSSSWQMYVIRSILSKAHDIVTGPTDIDRPPDIMAAARNLSALVYSDIDIELKNACFRAWDSDQKRQRSLDPDNTQDALSSALLECARQQERKPFQEALSRIVRLFLRALGNREYAEVRSARDAVATIEFQISKGVSALVNSRAGWEAVGFLVRQAEETDLGILKDFLRHSRREIRGFARSAIFNTAPKEAEIFAKSSSDWIRCARSWKDRFEDVIQGKRCLEKAESLAKDQQDWERCIDFCLNNPAYGDVSARLHEAEPMLVATPSWIRWAGYWNQLGNRVETLRCLREAENRAVSFYDWSLCSSMWEDCFSNEEEAERCMDIAKAADENPDAQESEDPLTADALYALSSTLDNQLFY